MNWVRSAVEELVSQAQVPQPVTLLTVLLLLLAAGAPAVGQTSSTANAGSHEVSCSAGLPALALSKLDAEPQPRLIAYPPVPSHLAQGRVVIQYCAVNVRILPVFGEAAVSVSPRIGHLHITVDGGPWRWLDTSNQPIVVNKLPPGRHTILLELVDALHRTVDKQEVEFVVPAGVK